MPELPKVWREFLGELPETAVFDRAEREYRAAEVYPPEEALFRAFALTPPERVRAVILGQDPYHEPGQAMGLAFSVPAGTPLPPSLKNIFTELESDLGLPRPSSGDLTPWAEQGVLLLNTVLTVRRGQANSHSRLGWQAFTDRTVQALGRLPQPVAFVLWGAQAQKKAGWAADSPYPRLVLQAPHPSPLSVYRGFYGSRPFSRINEFLRNSGEKEINWKL